MPNRTSATTTQVEEKALIAEQFYSQVSESIKLVFDLTSRIDERVKMLVERQNELDERLDRFLEIQQQTIHRLTVLETKDVNSDMKKDLDEARNKIQLLELKCEGIQQKTTHHDTRMNQIFDWVLKIMFMMLGGYLLYKFGWQSPPTP